LGQELFNKVFEINFGASVLKLNPNLPAGIYIIHVASAGQVEVQKIIKI
jgi:hypothetical protein